MGIGIDPDGTVYLIARSGRTIPLGTITRISPGLTGASASGDIGINQQGQVALTPQMNGPDVLLLTPKSPAGAQQTP